MCGTPEKDAQDIFCGKNECPRRETRLMFRNQSATASDLYRDARSTR